MWAEIRADIIHKADEIETSRLLGYFVYETSNLYSVSGLHYTKFFCMLYKNID